MTPNRKAVLGAAILVALTGSAWAQSAGTAAAPAAAPSAGSATAATTTSGSTRTITTPSGGSGTITIGGSSAGTTQRTGTMSVVGNGTGSARIGARASTSTGATAATGAQTTTDTTAATTATPVTTASALRDFAALDLDANGVISTTEARSNTALSPRFSKGDVDADGLLSRAEFDAMLSANEAVEANAGNGTSVDAGPRGRVGAGADAGGSGRVGATIAPVAIGLSAADFATLDANHDGLLTSGELSDSPASSRFADFDVDGNGTLSRAEWQAFVATTEQ